jgi:multidrug resistance efflux pump
MRTGSTLALLPAENATGNFVKVVQRLPVRIDLEGTTQTRTLCSLVLPSLHTSTSTSRLPDRMPGSICKL